MRRNNAIPVVVASLALLLAACNQNYVDIMSVSQRLDTSAEADQKQFDSSSDEVTRAEAKRRLVAVRKKQVVMMDRFLVSTMPQVKDGEMTAEQGKARKQELIEQAKKRLADAEALKVGVPKSAAPAAPAAPAAGAAPATGAAGPAGAAGTGK